MPDRGCRLETVEALTIDWTASPSLNAKVGALALCRASHFTFASANADL